MGCSALWATVLLAYMQCVLHVMTCMCLLGRQNLSASVLGADPEKDGTDGFFVAVFQRK